MTKKEIEEVVGKELTVNEVSVNKSIYAGMLYFYYRELKQDHYFYVPKNNKLYVMIHDVENYDDEITPTGKYPDSSKFNFDGLVADGKVKEMSEFDRDTNTMTEGAATTDKDKKLFQEWLKFGLGEEEYNKRQLPPEELKEVRLVDIEKRIDKIIIELTDLKAELRK